MQSAEAQMLGLFYKKGSKNPRLDLNPNTDYPPLKIKNIVKIVKSLKDFSLPDKAQPIPICKYFLSFKNINL